MKQAFKSKELSTIRVRELKWYKKDKEIVVNGTLFDVSTATKQPDGTFIVKGLYDHQEQNCINCWIKPQRKIKNHRCWFYMPPVL